tara:strand:- start:5727 stop:5861 length:135 start_codon:yes stop_codon:yes gene_type:complete
MAKIGRPKGTTRAAGYKVSPGRPPKKKSFFDIIMKKLSELLSLK